jgi:alpha-glucosidase
VSAFKPHNMAPVIIGTPCRTLASYVVLQNHLPMAADYPSAYRGHPALPVLAAIPTTWDDTRTLQAVPGEVIVIARRHGDTWWIGGMNDRKERELRVPLRFLDAGQYAADIWRDDADAPYSLAHAKQEVDKEQTLRVQLAPAGGVLIRLKPLAP